MTATNVDVPKADGLLRLSHVVLLAVCLPIFMISGWVFFPPHFSGIFPSQYFFGPFWFGTAFTLVAYNLHHACTEERRLLIPAAIASEVAMALLFTVFLQFMNNAQYEWVII